MHLGSLSPTVSGSCGKDPLSPTLTWRRFQMPSQKGVKNRLYSTDAYQCDDGDFPLREGSSPDGIAPPEGKSAPAQVPPRDGGASSRKSSPDFF